MIKKLTAAALTVLLVLSTFAGCTNNENKTEAETGHNIVCTIFPVYDWVKNILGESESPLQASLLLSSGTDLHSYQATPADFVALNSCGLFIFVGGESDMRWVSDALKTAGGINTLNLLDALGDTAKLEDTEEEEYDEHIWLSLKNAEALCFCICDAISEIDPENAGLYKENTESYVNELAALDIQFEEAVKNSAFKTVLFGDRFPFLYLCDDYGITHYAAFSGCSAETDASFETVASLAKTMDALNLPAAAVTESSDQSIAKTIIETTKRGNQKIVVFDSLQSVSKQDIADGKTYISAMTYNLSALKSALN